LRPLCPDEAALTLGDVDLERLVRQGKKLVMLDVDNTLLPWRSEDIPQETFDWITRGKSLGLTFVIISNTRKRARLGRLAGRLDVSFMTGKFKPSRAMYRQALSDHGVEAHEAVMVGDQLFTDVLGANRSGVDAIWVKPIARKEFVSTRVNRVFERFVRLALYRYLEGADDAPPDTPGSSFWRRRVVRQFAKFCLVGLSCFIIDAGLHRLLMFHAAWGGEDLSQMFGRWLLSLGYPRTADNVADSANNAAATLFKIPTAGIAIVNSFIWNRRWTFKIKGREGRTKQFTKFVIVSLVGMGLNVLIFSLVNKSIPGEREHRWLVATVVATGLVALWNFSGQRLWALKKHDP
jgi:HAD superfamily phosphatase (TIGR01668 family)